MDFEILTDLFESHGYPDNAVMGTIRRKLKKQYPACDYQFKIGCTGGILPQAWD
jgi:hypothetical protein